MEEFGGVFFKCSLDKTKFYVILNLVKGEGLAMINKYERYVLANVRVAWIDGEYCPILVNRLTEKAKNLKNDNIFHYAARPVTVDKFVAINVRPNKEYSSKLMLDAQNLMQQANWNLENFERVWGIANVHRIVTREELLAMTDEVNLQMVEDERKAKVEKEVYAHNMNF
ncbi:MAG: hypothetical protein ACI4PF_04495 [Christensenellales bacterium]